MPYVLTEDKSVVKQQAITRANVDTDLWYHVTSLDHNVLDTITLSLQLSVLYLKWLSDMTK